MDGWMNGWVEHGQMIAENLMGSSKLQNCISIVFVLFYISLSETEIHDITNFSFPILQVYINTSNI